MYRSIRIIPYLCCLLALAVPASAQYTYLDEDFEDGVADGFTPSDPDWTVVDGLYRHIAFMTTFRSMSVAGDVDWKIYQLDCDVLVSIGTEHAVAVRVADPGNFYEFVVRGGPWHEARLVKHVDGAPQIEATAYVYNNTGYWQHLTVIADGDRILASINGKQVFDWRDTGELHSGGGIALVGNAGDDINYRLKFFDNVLVTSAVVPAETMSWGRVKALYR